MQYIKLVVIGVGPSPVEGKISPHNLLSRLLTWLQHGPDCNQDIFLNFSPLFFCILYFFIFALTCFLLNKKLILLFNGLSENKFYI